MHGWLSCRSPNGDHSEGVLDFVLFLVDIIIATEALHLMAYMAMGLVEHLMRAGRRSWHCIDGEM